MKPGYCLRYQENIGHSQPLPLTLALSNIWQLLCDASLARPAEPTPGGKQLCKYQIKQNSYSSQHFSTVICAIYCPWNIHMWLYSSGREEDREQQRLVKEVCLGHFGSQTCQLVGWVPGSHQCWSSQVWRILWDNPPVDGKSAQAPLLLTHPY